MAPVLAPGVADDPVLTAEFFEFRFTLSVAYDHNSMVYFVLRIRTVEGILCHDAVVIHL